MVIVGLKFENAPSWAPEEAKKLIEKKTGVFEFRGLNYTTTYTFSSDWKTCKIVNKPDRKNAKCFEFNVKVDEIEFEKEN